jgi:hypothetical protein
LIIPKPFSKLILIAGDPIYVPRDLTSAQLQLYVGEIQAAMDRLDENAQRVLEGADPAICNWKPQSRAAV